MRAKALASEVGLRMASRDKAIADTGLVTIKTREEQALADAQDAAARAGPAALNAAVPMPVPVEAPRPSLDAGGYGPQPGVVSPEAQRMHDAQVQQNTALWPLIVRSGANPAQLIEGVGKGEGLSALSGGLVPGSTPDANTQRVAGGLYTGTSPTTSTVWSPGDTAGVDADARGKILQDRAKPPEPKMFGDMPYLINPDGSIRPAQGFVPKPDYRDLNGGIVQLGPNGATPVPGAAPQPKLPERQMIGDVLHERQPDGSWRPVTGPAAPQAKAPERQVMDGVVYERDPVSGKWSPATGIAPPAPGEPGAFAGQNSLDGVASKIVSNTSVRMQDNTYKPTLQEATDYATGYNHLYQQPKQSFEKDGQGNTVLVTTMPEPPAGVLTPAQVYARVPGFKASAPSAAPPPPPLAGPSSSQAPPPAPPVQSPPASPVAAPVAAPAAPASVPTGNPIDNSATNLAPGANVRVQKILSGSGKPPTAEEQKSRLFFTRALLGTVYLDKMKNTDVPDALTNWFAGQDSNGVLNAIGNASLDSNTRNFITAKTAFGTAQLRDESGAAINSGEFVTSDKTYIPQPGDGPDQLAQKRELRHAYTLGMLQNAYSGDPQGLSQALEQSKAMGVDLTPHPEDLPVPASSRNAKPPLAPTPQSRYPTPPAGVDPKDWAHVPEPDRSKFF